MSTLDERVTAVEGKVEEHSGGFGDLRGLISRLDEKIDRRIDAIDRRIDGLDEKIDRRIDALDQKVDRFREELAARIDGQTARIDRLDQKFSRHFLWLLGVQVTTLIAIVGALVAR